MTRTTSSYRKRVIKAFFAVALIFAALFVLCEELVEKETYKFDSELEGETFAILHETYFRAEPTKEAGKLAKLEVGETVETTGAICKRSCPFTTCKCGGGNRTWVQVVENDNCYWILEEAIH